MRPHDPRKKKRGIDLFVLLIEECRPKVVAMLKRHKVEDAAEANANELYSQLHELYFNNDVTSKQELEREMAAMHPHSEWLLRILTPDKVEVETIQAPSPQAVDANLKTAATADQKNSSFDSMEISSNCGGGCNGCPMKMSNFSGSNNNSPAGQDKTHHMITVVALVAIVGLTLHFIKHSKLA